MQLERSKCSIGITTRRSLNRISLKKRRNPSRKLIKKTKKSHKRKSWKTKKQQREPSKSSIGIIKRSNSKCRKRRKKKLLLPFKLCIATPRRREMLPYHLKKTT